VVMEFVQYDAREHVRTTPLSWPAVWLVTAALATLVGGALMFALSPRRDPLQLSERGRTAYVYAAEMLVVLMLLHVRLNVPDIFPVVGKYWVFVIMAVAFGGVGVAELFQGRGLTV